MNKTPTDTSGAAQPKSPFRHQIVSDVDRIERVHSADQALGIINEVHILLQRSGKADDLPRELGNPAFASLGEVDRFLQRQSIADGASCDAFIVLETLHRAAARRLAELRT